MVASGNSAQVGIVFTVDAATANAAFAQLIANAEKVKVTFKQTGAAARKGASDISKTGSAAKKSSNLINSFTKRLGALAGAYASLRTVEAAVTSFIQFDHALAEVSTLVDTAVFDMNRVKTASLEMAQQFGTSITSQAKAFYQAISAGATDAATAVETMNVANKLALGGVTTIENAVDGLTSVVNAYGVTQEGINDVADNFFTAMRLGKTTVDELSKTIGTIAPTAKAAGVEMDELFGSIAAVTKGGIKTDNAVVALNQAITAFLKPSEQAKEEAARLGVEFNISTLRTKGLQGALREITSNAKFTTNSFSKLFGNVRSLRAVLALSNNEGKIFADVMDQMGDRSGAANDAVAKMAESTQTKINRLKASFENLSEAIVKLTVDGAGGVQFLTDTAEAVGKIADAMRSAASASDFWGQFWADLNRDEAMKFVVEPKIDPQKAKDELSKNLEKIAQLIDASSVDEVYQKLVVNEEMTAVQIAKFLEETVRLQELAEKQRLDAKERALQKAADLEDKNAEKQKKKAKELADQVLKIRRDLVNEIARYTGEKEEEVAKRTAKLNISAMRDELAATAAREQKEAAANRSAENALALQEKLAESRAQYAKEDAETQKATQEQQQRETINRQKQQLQVQLALASQLGSTIASTVGQGWRAAMAGGDAFEDFVKSMLERLAAQIATSALIAILGSIFTGGATSFGSGFMKAFLGADGGQMTSQGFKPIRAANGYQVPNTGTDRDVYPALLRRGETVITPEQAASRGGSTVIINAPMPLSIAPPTGAQTQRHVRDSVYPALNRAGALRTNAPFNYTRRLG